jgi:asparagine synthase (glutamine-hydrolysing)
MKYYNLVTSEKLDTAASHNILSNSFRLFENQDYLLIGDIRLFDTEFNPLAFIQLVLESSGELNSIDAEYSFAILDKAKKELYLGRDPMGVKNIYYSFESNEVKISSNVFDLISLRRSNKFSVKGVAQFIFSEFIYDPHTLFEGVWSVSRGQLIVIDLTKMRIKSDSVFRIKLKDIEETPETNEKYLASELRQKIVDAHRKRLEDRNTIMLSGGIDSTVMAVTLKKDLASEHLSAITFDTKKAEYSEVEYAKSVAKQMGIKHQIIQVDPFNHDVDMFELIDRSNFPYMGSIFLESILRQNELSDHENFFAGQDTRLHTPALNVFDAFYLKWMRISHVNNLIAKVAKKASEEINIGSDIFNKVLDRTMMFGDRYEYILENLFHVHKNSILPNSQFLEDQKNELKNLASSSSNLRKQYNSIVDVAWSWQYTDDIAYMSNNLSHDGHTTSMPFYDYNLSQFSASLPMHLAMKKTKGRAGYGGKFKYVNKYLLRQAYKSELSPDVIFRDKAVAITNHIYLNTIMSKYIEDLFQDTSLRNTEIYEELNLSNLITIALENNRNWTVSDYTIVTEVQNLLFVEIIARKYQIND